ncbi:uracil permease [Clostridium cylindrosporum]|uniref:Uracil permease UraA n=1 Tax=Clostridium cylindrosporum DSM 605 TaxID=1121307 RepID=A0A0J8G0Y9_CLOCY|nr:uracil permease [Clostridium cylindrosporum]KMT21441.1 uracil permease UraA [Clostridium cylindrosporum DSM 605]
MNQTKEELTKKDFVDVRETLPFIKALPLSLQHMFAMFGSSVLVPILLGVDPATVLLFNGIGTLLYIAITKAGIPSYLGSSFAFIAPAAAIIGSQGYEYALGGFITAGAVFSIVGLIVKKTGINWINLIFPPAAMGAILAVMGLELGPVAADMAGFIPKNGALNTTNITISVVTLAIAIFGSMMFRGFLKVIPVLISVAAGYILSVALGVVDFSAVVNAPWFALPHFTTPKFSSVAIFTILPAVFVVLAEHIGHLIVTGNLVGRKLEEEPGLHRSLLGDGISTMLSGCFGSVPTTTYGENIGVMSITRVYSVWVIGGAAVFSILLSVSGKLTEIIRTIPTPVMGGISLLLFGTIAVAGLRVLIEQKVDFSKSRNLILTSIIMVIGLSGVKVNIGVPLSGMGLATIVAILLNIIFIVIEKLNLTNDN